MPANRAPIPTAAAEVPGRAAIPAARIPGNWPLVAAFWLLVTLPLLWGSWQTLTQAAALFRPPAARGE